MQDFILHWGEMGTKWGTNRTISQIFALLFLSERALDAEEIADTLSVARSNVSTSIRELQSWRVLKTVHVLGERRDYFTTPEDIWEIFRIIVEERKKREIDPTLTVLRQCLITDEEDKSADQYAKARLTEIHDFFVTTTTWYEQLNRLPNDKLVSAIKMGGRIGQLLPKKK